MLTKPNLIVPLAVSYNQNGNTPVLSNKYQRKLNCYYDIIENSFSGGKEVYVCKRPGVVEGETGYGSSTQTPYLISGYNTSGGTGQPVLFLKDTSNNLQVYTAGAANTITTTGNLYDPLYVTSGYIGGSNLLLVQFGSNGVSTGGAWVSGNGTSWTQITDTDFGNNSVYGKVEIMDGYVFALKFINNNVYIIHSDLNSSTAWSASSLIQKTIFQDSAGGLARFENQILAFGKESVEVFYNAGNTTGSILGRLPHLSANIGLKEVSSHYYCTIQNKMYFLGNAASGTKDSDRPNDASSALYSYDGTKFERIEHPIINKILTNSTIYSVDSFPIAGKLGISIQLTAPTSTTGHYWLVYFPEYNEWFEFTSDVFQPRNDGYYFLGQLKSGASTADKLYIFDGTEKFQDVSTNYSYLLQFSLPGADGLPHMIPYCGVIGDTATSATLLTIAKSIDDWQNITNVGTIDMTKARKAKYGLGMFQSEMGIQLSYTGANNIRLSKFYATIT